MQELLKMKIILICALFAVLLIVVSPAEDRAWQIGYARLKWDNNCDFNGHDIACMSGFQDGECAKMCFHNDRCTHFTQNGECCLKNADRIAEIERPSAVCGFIPGRSKQSTK